MLTCRYCDRDFARESAYKAHLRDEHADELGPIDRRRLGITQREDGISVAPLALGVVLLVSVVAVVYVSFFAGSSGAGGQPSNIGSVHYHGTITMTVDGQQVDFSQPRYQRPQESPAFHFEGGDGQIWHVHAQGVTLKYAMSTLDIGVTRSSVTFEGRTYNDSDPNTNVVVEVNGQPVDPSTYVLQGVTDESQARTGGGDHIRIIVTSDSANTAK